ncbi:Aqualysin-1 [Drechslerella dactyloides]|uniref:Aqualysin-1 n=1 Tax=Drechslerella dactyloides TaxID=74499 RepID=A0AAD6J159_DREDA|nr:Aqualysin-1 [Drechslerella dactyloides]
MQMSSILLSPFLLLLATLEVTLAAPTPASKDVDALADSNEEYIVLMKETEKRPWSEIFSSMGHNQTEVGAKTFGHNIRAFTMAMKSDRVSAMSALDSVAIVAKNYRRATAVMPTTAKPWDMPAAAGFSMHNLKRQAGGLVEQGSAPWNLARIATSQPVEVSQGQSAIDLAFSYKFDRQSGSGVDVYVLDTGINVAHQDFNGRAKMIFSAFGDDGRDNEGHGTHTAGTIGSLTFGVAKNVNLWGVKVLDTQGGSDSAIAAGVDAAITQHNQRKGQPGFMGSVISMSLGGPAGSPAITDIMRRATDAGIHVSVAAGNENTDACSSEPGRLSTQIPLITVGATDINDARAGFSNFGRCVDIHAPGVQVVSTFNKGPRSVMPLDGTSMACPAVTGVIADLLAKNPNLKTDPAGMKKLLLSMAQKGVIRGVSKMPPNGMVMLNTGIVSAPGSGVPRNGTLKRRYQL